MRASTCTLCRLFPFIYVGSVARWIHSSGCFCGCFCCCCSCSYYYCFCFCFCCYYCYCNLEYQYMKPCVIITTFRSLIEKELFLGRSIYGPNKIWYSELAHNLALRAVVSTAHGNLGLNRLKI